MSQLRLAFSRNDPIVTPRKSRKRSTPSSLALRRFQLISWKLERLEQQRPAALDVIERLVDNILGELEGRKL